MRVRPLCEATQAVGIHTRVDQHDRVLQELVDRVALRGRQVIRQQQGRVAATRLVAMNAVTHPHHGRARFRLSAGEYGLDVRTPDFLDAREVLGRADRRQDERSFLVRSSVRLELNAR